MLRVVVIGAAAGAAAFTTAGRAEADTGDVFAGTVVSTGPDGMTIRTPQETIVVVPATGATLYSGASGLVSSTAEFRVGDRVGVAGARTGNRLVATKIGSVFTPVSARVDRISDDGGTAETSAGRVRLAAGRLPVPRRAGDVRSAAGLQPGMVLSGLGWTDPSSGDRYLLVRE